MTYQIADEPIETQLRAYVVRPHVPLLALALGGTWLAWPWFAFNAIAMGSPTRRKEVALCIAAFAITGVLAAIVIALVDAGVLPETGLAIRLALLEALTAAAEELTSELAPQSVEVRLRGRDPEFIVSALDEDAREHAADDGDNVFVAQYDDEGGTWPIPGQD